jgi:DNA-binding response OmpR family regulator
LEAADYRCLSFATHHDCELQIDVLDIKTVLLDDAGPSATRIQAIRGIRSVSDVPVLIVTACAEERDKVDSLDAGADDYLTKPVAAHACVLRFVTGVRAVVRSADECAWGT